MADGSACGGFGDQRKIAARVEFHPFSTLTLTDQQFLAGDNGKPVTLSGELSIARDGPAAGRDPDARFRRWGGISSTGRATERDGHLHLRHRRHDRARADRVGNKQAVLGRLDIHSRCLSARWRSWPSTRASIRPHRPDGVLARRAGRALCQPQALPQDVEHERRGFRRLCRVLSGLRDDLIADTDVATRPIRIFHGTPDDYNPVATCKASSAGWTRRLRRRAHRVSERAAGFDNPLGFVPARPAANHDQSVRDCATAKGDKRRADQRRPPRAVRLYGCVREAAVPMSATMRKRR